MAAKRHSDICIDEEVTISTWWKLSACLFGTIVRRYRKMEGSCGWIY
jgi:hypothetical protein